MKVAGGVYVERCLVPEWRQVFGSGGRAAATIAAASLGTELHTYCAEDYLADAEATLAAFGVQLTATTTDTAVYFSYFHPISNPEIDPLPSQIQRRPSLRVAGDVVLRFGFMEGDAVIEADWAIYDPQSGLAPERFHANGSKARHLAIVLNEGELATLTGLSDQAEAAETLKVAERAEVVVVKAGTRGATVYARGSKPKTVPAYRSRRVFKIGSGDVFTATFARRWGEERHDPVDAADLASRSAAWYCESRTLPLPAFEELEALSNRAISGSPGTIYLAAPFFNIGQRWVVEEARACLFTLGAQVFSPLHDVGFGPSREVAPADLDGLRQCSAVLAIVDGGDPGTLFEVGYARAHHIPVIVLSESAHERDLIMPEGSGCEVVHDFSTALYRAVWASAR